MAIKALLFDKDGTLFHFQETWGNWCYGFLADIAQDTQNYDDLAKALHFDPQTKRFAPDSVAIAGTVEEIADLISPLVPHLPKQSLIAYAETSAASAPIAPVTDLPTLFTVLRDAGFHLGIATNDAQSVAHSNLADAGITQFFDFVAGYDSGYTPKPAPDPVLAFVAHTGLAPTEVAMIGDSTHDLLAGQAAGTMTIAVLTGPATRDELHPYATHILNDIGELPALLL